MEQSIERTRQRRPDLYEKAWKFVALHKAPYSNGSHFDDEEIASLEKGTVTAMNFMKQKDLLN